MKFGGKFLKQSYCHACHTRSSPVVLCKLTILNYRLSIHFYVLSLLLCVFNRNLRKSLLVSRFALSKFLSCFLAFDTKYWPSSAHGDAYPCYAYNECRACAVYGFALTRSSKCGRKKCRCCGTLGAHLSAHVGAREKEKTSGTGSGRRCLGSRTYNLTACVVAYPGASNLPSHVNLRF